VADERRDRSAANHPAGVSSLDTPTYTATLDRFIAASAGDDGVRIDRLEPLTELVVRTCHSTYEILVADPRRSRIIVRGGQHFPIPTPATLRGSTLGGHCLKMGWIGKGFNMEIQAGSVVTITSPVQTIEFERSSDRQWTSEEQTDATTHDSRGSRTQRAGLSGLRVEH
jgi:hypothetical protein